MRIESYRFIKQSEKESTIHIELYHMVAVIIDKTDAKFYLTKFSFFPRKIRIQSLTFYVFIDYQVSGFCLFLLFLSILYIQKLKPIKWNRNCINGIHLT